MPLRRLTNLLQHALREFVALLGRHAEEIGCGRIVARNAAPIGQHPSQVVLGFDIAEASCFAIQFDVFSGCVGNRFRHVLKLRASTRRSAAREGDCCSMAFAENWQQTAQHPTSTRHVDWNGLVECFMVVCPEITNARLLRCWRQSLPDPACS